MSDALQLILEDTDGTQLETSCTRFAVIWQGKEVWIQTAGNGQLLIGVDVEEGDAEYANLLLRPLATNLVSLQLEMEPAEVDDEDEGHVHGPDCNH
ncbi:topoisomerase II [Aquipseudomonas ullengensis]|uniref:Topoisomerase II n=1 Tax=Aquipseudomonas ullengensis TaxID=2759166 RepID=A0A7W4LNN2_9GAMM|nr:topoisomerase II [Pseudomonas ullengensis]MBB2496497.1 topoisomerase II [Pseudomonas ullengensis]